MLLDSRLRLAAPHPACGQENGTAIRPVIGRLPETLSPIRRLLSGSDEDDCPNLGLLMVSVDAREEEA